jgi:hypothetical protein
MDINLMSNKLVDETAPKSIWICVGDEGNYHEAHSQGDLYWCEDKIDANDVKYIRADLVVAEITRLTAEVAELKSESEADAFSMELMSKLLAEICLTVKGEPPYLTRFSYHDLPKFVQDLKLDAERYRFIRDENNMKKSKQFSIPFIATHTNSLSAWMGIDADNVVDKAMQYKS